MQKERLCITCGYYGSPGVRCNRYDGGAATKPGITLEAGKVVQCNFHDYPVARFNEMPAIEIHILAERGKQKGRGVGLTTLCPCFSQRHIYGHGQTHWQTAVDLNAIQEF